ncbi:MAG: hypothetical protein JNJ90_16385 [Saprospiraceae bacterium]|jgi:hypothetical protein|nr:hypothetical protein [Saprospiraceae bacterium]
MFKFFPLRGGVLAAALMLLSLFSCHKDFQPPLPEHPQPTAKPNYPITLFEAMAHFAELQDAPASSFSDETKFIELNPVWQEAGTSQSQSGKDIVVVPLADSSLRVLNGGRVDAKLLFSKDGPDEITAEVVLYIADSAYYYSKNQMPDIADFTGVFAFFDIGLNFKYGITVDSGMPVGKVDSIFRSTTSGSANYRTDTPNEDCFTQIHTVIIHCPQAYSSCFDIMWVVTVICNSGPGGGTTGGTTGSTSGGTTGGTNNGGTNGGTSGNNNDPYGTFWDVFFGRVPMGIFTNNPSILPPGFDTTLVRNFIDIHGFFRFTPKQLQDLQKRPDFIAVLHEVYAAWFDVDYDPEQPDGRPDFALAKPVLDFAVKHKLTAAQFEALLRNGVLFAKVKAITEALILNNTEVGWITSNPVHATDLNTFLEKYGNEEGAKDHANTHLDNLMTDPEYREMSEASFSWPGIVWTIAQELIGDALIDLLLNQIPLFNNQDEVRDIIKSAKNGSWLEFSYETTKLVFKVLLKNNPYAKAVQALWEGSEKAAKISKALGKIETLLGTMSTQALERAWGIIKKMEGKLFEIEDFPKYLKYIDDLKTPKLGGYFATVNTYSANFKNKFSDVKDQIAQVHHAVPQKVKNQYNLVNDNQLHSLENLRGIPSNDNFHQTLTNAWKDFFDPYDNAGTVPSLADVLAFTKVIDDQYGHRFLPPIR